MRFDCKDNTYWLYTRTHRIHTNTNSSILKVNCENRHWFGVIFSQSDSLSHLIACFHVLGRSFSAHVSLSVALRLAGSRHVHNYSLELTLSGPPARFHITRWCALILIRCVLNKYSNYTLRERNAIVSTQQHTAQHSTRAYIYYTFAVRVRNQYGKDRRFSLFISPNRPSFNPKINSSLLFYFGYNLKAFTHCFTSEWHCDTTKNISLMLHWNLAHKNLPIYRVYVLIYNTFCDVIFLLLLWPFWYQLPLLSLLVLLLLLPLLPSSSSLLLLLLWLRFIIFISSEHENFNQNKRTVNII